MTEELDNVFVETVRKTAGNKNLPSDLKTAVGWKKCVCDDIQTYVEHRSQNRHNRHLRHDEFSGEDVPEVRERPLCTKGLDAYPETSTSKGSCPRKDMIAKLTPVTDMTGIRKVIERVANEEITAAAEFIFNVNHYVQDRGTLFREILQKELSYFRDIVEDTVDRRVQDEADVMMHTQNDIKNKFRSLTDAMIQRTMRIRQRLYEISPKFDWVVDGRDKSKISKLIVAPKQKEITKTPNVIEKLTHQVFMRGQWLKKELSRIQEENRNLKNFLEKFRRLAAERKAQESHVPRMLAKEKKDLELELNELQKIYKDNLEIIDALVIEHHRCIEPQSESSFHD